MGLDDRFDGDQRKYGRCQNEGFNELSVQKYCVVLREEDGVGVIEIVLILVVLIGLVIIFKKQINELLENVFKQINSKSKEVY